MFYIRSFVTARASQVKTYLRSKKATQSLRPGNVTGPVIGAVLATGVSTILFVNR